MDTVDNYLGKNYVAETGKLTVGMCNRARHVVLAFLDEGKIGFECACADGVLWSKMRVCSELAKLGGKTTTKTSLQQRLQLFVNSKAAELAAVQTETRVIWIPKKKQMGGETPARVDGNENTANDPVASITKSTEALKIVPGPEKLPIENVPFFIQDNKNDEVTGFNMWHIGLTMFNVGSTVAVSVPMLLRAYRARDPVAFWRVVIDGVGLYLPPQLQHMSMTARHVLDGLLTRHQQTVPGSLIFTVPPSVFNNAAQKLKEATAQGSQKCEPGWSMLKTKGQGKARKDEEE